VPLRVYQVSVCNAYVERSGSDEVGKKYVLWCGVRVKICGMFAGLSSSVLRCVL